jgi:hypothetical protein
MPAWQLACFGNVTRTPGPSEWLTGAAYVGMEFAAFPGWSLRHFQKQGSVKRC